MYLGSIAIVLPFQQIRPDLIKLNGPFPLVTGVHFHSDGRHGGGRDPDSVAALQKKWRAVRDRQYVKRKGTGEVWRVPK